MLTLDATRCCERPGRGIAAAISCADGRGQPLRRRRVPQMLARVPFIPRVDLVREAPHPRTWAIVLTGDEPPVDARTFQLRQARGTAARWPGAASAGRARPLERASRLVPPGQMVAVVTRRRARAWDGELADIPGARRIVQPSYRGHAV